MRCTKRRYSEDYSSVATNVRVKKMHVWQKALLYTGVTFFSLALIVFILIWVVFPLVFMLNLRVERFFMFWNIDNPKNPDFNNPEKYNIQGVNNFYITTTEADTNDSFSIGIWQIIPENMNQNEKNVTKVLKDNTLPIVLYLHGVACNRALPVEGYQVLRKKFLVFGMDHRGYGDSSGPPSELGIVSDNLQIYQWIKERKRPEVPIYIWGHSLGSALSCHTVRALKERRNEVPHGLILESAFTTMAEEIVSTSIGRLFYWLAYFKQTFLKPLDDHKLQFKTTSNILSVDCPIMIMHAVDDNVIPVKMGRTLKEKAMQRKPEQGETIYHEFPALGYMHVGIIRDPKIPEYIDEFMAMCDNHKRTRRVKREDSFQNVQETAL